MNQTNPGLPDSKAANKAEANRVVANRAADSSAAARRVADDKPSTVN